MLSSILTHVYLDTHKASLEAVKVPCTSRSVFLVWHRHCNSQAVGYDFRFFTSQGFPWAATAGLVSTLHLVVRFVFCFELGIK